MDIDHYQTEPSPSYSLLHRAILSEASRGFAYAIFKKELSETARRGLTDTVALFSALLDPEQEAPLADFYGTGSGASKLREVARRAFATEGEEELESVISDATSTIQRVLAGETVEDEELARTDETLMRLRAQMHFESRPGSFCQTDLPNLRSL